MSTERTSLRSWIERLVSALEDDPWGAGGRLRDLVWGYTARIVLDGGAVLVSMPGEELEWLPATTQVDVDGEGATTSAVVVAILDKGLEVTDAVERGLVQAAGSPDAVLRMFHAIEVILDASARVPALRALADEFRREAGANGVGGVPEPPRPPGTEMLALLDRLGVANHRA
jgi:hypothetical protein